MPGTPTTEMPDCNNMRTKLKKPKETYICDEKLLVISSEFEKSLTETRSDGKGKGLR